MIPSRMLAAVLFDFGGVLYDMRWDVAHELADAHGLPHGAIIDTLYRTTKDVTLASRGSVSHEPGPVGHTDAKPSER